MIKKMVGLVLALVLLLLGGMASTAAAYSGTERGTSMLVGIMVMDEWPGKGLVAGVLGTEPFIYEKGSSLVPAGVSMACLGCDKGFKPSWALAVFHPPGVKYLPDIA